MIPTVLNGEDVQELEVEEGINNMLAEADGVKVIEILN